MAAGQVGDTVALRPAGVWRMSLTKRIVGFTILVTTLVLWGVVLRSESVLEDAFLAQTKRQAEVFLLGIEAEIQQLDNPTDPAALQRLISQTVSREHLGALSFAVYDLYIFDKKGHILARSRPGPRSDQDLTGEKRRVISDGEPSLGEEVEYVKDPESGRVIPKSDVIIPLHVGGQVVAALEVELNLEETMSMIKSFDDSYEENILLVMGIGFGGLVLLLWWGIHRWLIASIRSLVRVTERIAAGELTTREEQLGRDELGDLGSSVNAMADSIEELFNAQEQAHLQMLQALAKALEAKDSNTASHSARVAKFSVQLGRRLGLPEEQLKLLKQGALMHDLGKIGIDDSVLNKPSTLDDHEYEIMQRHPVLTASIMRPLKRFKEFAEIAAWHHERWDGNGYPDGLKDEQIPLLARIVAIADTWDAMTGDRVYREGMSADKALSILEREQDSGQWDPALVRTFVEMVRGDLEARVEVVDDMFGAEAPAASGEGVV